MMHRGVRASLAVVAAAVLLSSCGGGGGGGSQPAPQPPAPPPPTYTVGGTVSGLAGGGLVLRNNGGNDLAISANGTFTFTTALTSGGAYAVAVHTQPTSPRQTCTVASGSGSVNANVTNVAVTCVNTYTVGGTITGLVGTGLVLRSNGETRSLSPGATQFTFPTAIVSGGAYAVSVEAQPAGPTQTCSVASDSGTVSADVTNVTVTCVTNTYRLGGTVTDLVGTGLVLRNGGDDLAIAANGAFTFATRVPSGASYAVVVLTNPTAPTQACAVSNAGGTIGSSDVTNVAIKCGYRVGGTVTGLQGNGLVLRNNGGDSLPIAASGAFSFPTLLNNGETYDVAAFTHPLNPDQECTTTRGTGTVSSADVTDIAVNCYVMGKWLYMTNGLTKAVTGATINQTTGMLDAIAGGPSAPPGGRFLYVTDGDASTISGYAVNPTSGVLTAVPNSPVAGGHAPIELPTVDPTGRFLYATDQTNPRFFGYRIDELSGELTLINGSPFATAAGTIYARIDPTGRFLYVVTRSMTPVVDAIALSTYSINASTGELTAVGTPIAVGTSMPMPGGMELSADGAALFILPSPNPSLLYGYALNAATGSPAPMQGSPFTLPMSSFHLRPHPRLPVLYVGGTNRVAAYGIGATLMPLTGSPYTVTGAPLNVGFDPGARFLYAQTANEITSFEVESDGALEAMIDGTLATPSASKMLVDPGGRYLFISDYIPGNVYPIAINTRDGRLSLVQGGAFAGGNGTQLLGIVK